MIYDIRSSGNQAQCALRKVAEIFKDKYSNVHQIILKLTYMNDCMVGDKDKEKPTKRQDDLQMVLGCGGFNLKGFTVSGKDPDELLTSDGVSVSPLADGGEASMAGRCMDRITETFPT